MNQYQLSPWTDIEAPFIQDLITIGWKCYVRIYAIEKVWIKDGDGKNNYDIKKITGYEDIYTLCISHLTGLCQNKIECKTLIRILYIWQKLPCLIAWNYKHISCNKESCLNFPFSLLKTRRLTDCKISWLRSVTLRVRFWAVQNLFWAGRCPKLGLNPPFTAQNCPKLPQTAQNCLKLPTDYESAKLILGQISNLVSLSFLMLEKIS